jgi:hypothetical protein
LLLFPACFSPGDGVPPPPNEIYFPTGLALDDALVGAAGARHLYVANSDFDLQYSSSILAAYDLEQFRSLLDPTQMGVVPRPCNTTLDCQGYALGTCDNQDTPSHVASHFCVGDDLEPCPTGERSEADKLLYPGRCNPIDPVPLITARIGIGAFATDIIYRKRPDSVTGSSDLGRLFLPVRGDATLHWIRVESDAQNTLDCGEDTAVPGSPCDDGHRAGKKQSESPIQTRMLPEPFGIDATADGREIVVTNQTSGALTLFYNPWSESGASVLLTDEIGGLPLAPVTVAAVPVDASPQTNPAQPGFLVGYADAAQIDLVRVDTSLTSIPGAINAASRNYPLIYLSGTVSIAADSIGSNSRGIAVDDSVSPARVFASNRAPPSLLVGALRTTFDKPDLATDDLPAFTDSVPLNAGPSRVVLGKVRLPDGSLALRVFVVCFDSRSIYIYDPNLRQVEAIVRTGRGPYALAIDEARNLAYVGHFTDSFLGVISLDQHFPDTYATMIATIGQPLPPRTSK